MNDIYSLLVLDQVIFKLIIVFGVVFLDFLVMLTVRDSFEKIRWKNTWHQSILIKFIWIILLSFNIFFLQQLLYLTHNSSGDLNIFWNNSDLQIMVLFYFLYMLDDRIIIYFAGLIAIIISILYDLQGRFTTPSTYILAFIALISIIISSYIINGKQKIWIDKPIFYIVTEVVFSGSWGLLIMPTMVKNHAQYGLFVFNFVIIMFVIHLINILVRKRVLEYSTLTKNLKLDYLTGIGNRGAFDHAFNEAFPIFKRENLSLTFAMCDIDHFKKFNDKYGHVLGDKVLREVAQTIKKTLDRLGSHGQVFRIGGEEFGILFRNNPSDATEKIMMQICQDIYQLPIKYHGEILNISMSVGVSQILPCDNQLIDIYKRVDGYLYKSKNAGRAAITTEGITKKYSISNKNT